MPGQGRAYVDLSNTAADAHGCPACPHPALGPGIEGSPNVEVNCLPALRVDDHGVHVACCGPNNWKAIQGSATVLINGKSAHRMGDQAQHCGGIGTLITASANVLVGGPTACSVAQADKRFGTAEEAAIDAMQEANPHSIHDNLEYGGWVHKNADGTFSSAPATVGQPAGLTNMPAKGANDTVWWHTHGAYDPAYDNENFSGATGDKGYSKANNATGYVATPGGAIKRYDPSTNTVTTLPAHAPTS